jgi:hypothetical protein
MPNMIGTKGFEDIFLHLGLCETNLIKNLFVFF